MKEREACTRKESVVQDISKSEVNYAEKVDGTFGLITFATVVDQCLSFVILPREKRFVDSNRGRRSTWFCGPTCTVAQCHETTCSFLHIVIL